MKIDCSGQMNFDQFEQSLVRKPRFILLSNMNRESDQSSKTSEYQAKHNRPDCNETATFNPIEDESTSTEDDPIENGSISTEDDLIEYESTSIEDNSIEDNSIEDNSIEDNSIEDESILTEDDPIENDSTLTEDNSIEDDPIEDYPTENGSTSIEDDPTESGSTSIEGNSIENESTSIEDNSIENESISAEDDNPIPELAIEPNGLILTTNDSAVNKTSTTENNLIEHDDLSAANDKILTLDAKQISNNSLTPEGNSSAADSVPITNQLIEQSDDRDLSTCQPIQLKDYQEDHVRRIYQMFKSNPVVFDFSLPGRGKSWITAAIAMLLKLPILLISPPTGFRVWEYIERNHGLVILNYISYDILRGQHGRQCNHLYLTRDSKDNFRPTKHLKKIIKDGVLIVFDEISKVKNPGTAVKKSAHAIIKCLVNTLIEPGKNIAGSRALLLSALPCDKPDHILSLIQMLGIILQNKIYIYDNVKQSYDLTGFDELINWCLIHDKQKTNQIISLYPVINKKSIPHIAVKLYQEIINKYVSSCMPAPHDQEVDIKNGHYKLIGEDLDLLRIGQRLLHQAIKYKFIMMNKVIDRRKTNWGHVIKAVRLLGKAKLRKIYALAKHDLDSNPNRKVVIGLWYRNQLRWMADALKEYGTCLLYGQTKNRDKVIDLFRQPDPTIRVMVTNPTVGGLSISLDDRYGGWPRSLYANVDFRLDILAQFFFRVNRESTKSLDQTKIRLVNAKEFKEESRILMSLIRKSETARSVISDKSGLILPDRIGEEIESDEDDPIYLNAPSLSTIKEENNDIMAEITGEDTI